MDIDDEELQTLIAARAKAEELVAKLLQQQAEVEASPPDLPAEKLAAGRLALQKAIESAQRMLENLDAALKIATGPIH
jgi:molecular chaperone GrpE (heat shock protein)